MCEYESLYVPQGGEAYRLWLLWFHFLLWQPPALLWLFTGEFAYHFFTFVFYFSLSLSILTTTCASSTIHGWISLSLFVACLFCNQFAITQTKYHSWAGMKTWPFNLLDIFQWKAFTYSHNLLCILFIIFSNLLGNSYIDTDEASQLLCHENIQQCYSW